MRRVHCIRSAAAYCLKFAALLFIFPSAVLVASQAAAAMTNQDVLFTGFLATPGTGSGMDILNAELSTIGIPDYAGRVFAWTEQQAAFDWIQQLQSDQFTLVLIGHSFGGNSALQLANDFLLPGGVDVDLTIQLDSVTNFGSGGNDQLPANVDVGINYYQISTGFLEPQGEDVVQGALNINVEVLFNDTSITHTSIDDDPRLHAIIGQNIIDNLNHNLNLEKADFDSNDQVDGNDYLIWQRGFGTTSTAVLSTCDANGDMAVTDEDLLIWQQQFGNGVVPRTASSTAVPEPNPLLLGATVGLVGAGICRRR